MRCCDIIPARIRHLDTIINSHSDNRGTDFTSIVIIAKFSQSILHLLIKDCDNQRNIRDTTCVPVWLCSHKVKGSVVTAADINDIIYTVHT